MHQRVSAESRPVTEPGRTSAQTSASPGRAPDGLARFAPAMPRIGSRASRRRTLWRKNSCACVGSCSHCRVSNSAKPGVQVSQPSDPEEREADAIAGRVLQGTPSAASAPADADTRLPRTAVVRPDTHTGAEPVGSRPPIRGARDSHVDVVPAGGTPLGERERARFESGLGHDLGDVRIHTGATAARLAHRYQAHAYTVGRDIVFGAGEFQPGRPDGDRLLAHELVHTIQAARALHPARLQPDQFLGV